MKEYNLIKVYAHKILIPEFWSTSGDHISQPEYPLENVPLLWQGKRGKWTIDVEYYKNQYTCKLSFGSYTNTIRKEITSSLETVVEYIQQMMLSPNTLEVTPKLIIEESHTTIDPEC